MKEKVLNLEELADEIVRVEYPTYENAPSGMREAIIRKKQRIKEILKQYLKCVCKFYLKYEDMPELLLTRYPELASIEIGHGNSLKDFAKHYDESVNEMDMNLNTFNSWLFRYVFREVVTEEIEKEVNNEQRKFIKLLEVMNEK